MLSSTNSILFSLHFSRISTLLIFNRGLRISPFNSSIPVSQLRRVQRIRLNINVSILSQR